jgi:hypothetical protein
MELKFNYVGTEDRVSVRSVHSLMIYRLTTQQAGCEFINFRCLDAVDFESCIILICIHCQHHMDIVIIYLQCIFPFTVDVVKF